MSRIGKKPIPMPAGVKYTVNGNTVLVEGLDDVVPGDENH